MKRPAFCPKEDHKKEELMYFCKKCEVPLCQICVTLDHGGHNMKLIKEEAETQKTEMKSFIEKQRHNLQVKTNAVSRLDEDCATLIQQGEDVKREIQTFVDNLIAVIEANKKNIFAHVEKETNKSIESIIRQKTEIERQMTAIKSFLEKAEKLFTQSTNAEIVQLKKTLDTIFERVHQIEPTDCDPELVAHFVFVENYKLFNTVKTEQIGTLKKPTKAGHCDIEGKGLEEGIALREAHFTLTTKDTEGRQCYNDRNHVMVEIRDEQGRECTSQIQIIDRKDGLYQVRYCPRDPGKCQVTVKVNGEHVRDSPFAVQVTPFQFKPVLSFGKEGTSEGMFRFPWGAAVNDKDEIVVTDYDNQRVQIFNSEGNYLRSFGRSATKKGEFQSPAGITYRNNGNIFVADSGNCRIQIFKGEGEYVGSFGGRGSLDSQLSCPSGLSVDSDGNIIVADSGNRMIKIFSPDGKFLTKIGGQGSFTFPEHCIQYERYLIVSDYWEHCIKVFDRKGNFQYKFGKKGGGDGELNSPSGLLVNKSGHLMVCDVNNDRIQVFELNGKFLGKFGRKGGNLGEFSNPISLAVLSNGQIVVCDAFNYRIQILE
ncbi:E3 ubiquitin-protein ligase TRIM71-like [Pocillopora verrucosa]|uniref:E3 ubiquitin-protein ligase TRIM71-like n=1 Tax=Pocillopora verrucosa TaxID=203993 RepID=UPI0033419487